MADKDKDAGTMITDLPPELMVRIASYLTTAELGPLRRSCKQIEANLFDNFASEFFTKRQFMIEHNSLEALVGIANHSGLAARLTEVLIGTQALDGSRLTAKEDFLAGRLQREMLLSSGKAHEMLSEAFSKLPNLRIVGLRDYNGAGRIRDGQGARWRSWGWSAASHSYESSPDALFPLLVSALRTANARPENIEVILRKSQLSPDSLAVANEHIIASKQPPLSTLKILFLAVAHSHHVAQEWGAPWDTYDNTDTTDAPFRRFLHAAPALEHLRLNFRPEQFLAHRMLDWLSMPTTSPPSTANQLPVPPAYMPHLSILDLGMAKVSESTLVRVLTRFDLKSFSLWKITIQAQDDSTDCWSRFLDALSTRLPASTSLRKIMIGNVSQHRSVKHSSLFVASTPVSFVAEGTEPEKKAEAQKVESVEFKAQYTGKTVHEWLKDLSDLTFVPGIHTMPEPESESEADEEDEAASDFDEEQDDADEDDDN